MSAAGELWRAAGDGLVREAPWLPFDGEKEDVALGGPPIWRWQIPISVRGAALEAYEGARDGAVPNRDAILVVEHRDRVVLAVADGVTPTSRTPWVGSIDGGRFAAHAVLRSVCAVAPRTHPIEALHEANRTILREFGHARGLRPRDHPQAAVVVAVVPTAPVLVDGVIAARAGDCDLWTRRGARWTCKTPQPMLVDVARELLAAWDEANPGATPDARIQVEERLLTDDSWNVTSVGRFRQPAFERHVASSEVDAVALVTDGVDMRRFGGDPPLEPRAWLPVPSHPAGVRADDVALLHLRLRRRIRSRRPGT